LRFSKWICVLWAVVGVMAVISAVAPHWVMAQPSSGATQPGAGPGGGDQNGGGAPAPQQPGN